MLLRFKEFIYEGKFEDWVENPTNSINSDHDPEAKNLTREQIANKIIDHIPDRVQKHFEWAVDKYNKGRMKLEDLPVLHNALIKYKKYPKQVRKLRNYSPELERLEGHTTYLDHNELHNHVESLDTTKKTIDSTRSQERIKAGSTPVYDSPNLTIHHVHNSKAFCEMAKTPEGHQLPLCTAAIDHKGNPSQGNRFDDYNAQSGGRFYFAKLHNAEAPHRRIAYAIGTGEFQDENNQKITGERLKTLVRQNPELKTSGHMDGVAVATTTNLDKHIHDLLDNDFDEVKKHAHLLNDESKRHLENYKNLFELSKISNPTPEETHQLINSRYHSIRMNTARNTRNPETLRRLSEDPHQGVRARVAFNKNTPLETKKHLTDDPIDMVRAHIDINSFPKEEQRKIYDKEKRMDIKVGHAVNAHNNRNSDLLSDALDKLDLSPEHLTAIVEQASNPNSEILDKIVNHRHFDKVEDDEYGYKQDLITDFLTKHPNPTEHPSFNQLSDSNKQDIIKDFLSNHPNPTEHPLFNKLNYYNKQDIIKDFLSKQQNPTEHPLFNQLDDYNKQAIITDFLKKHPNPTEHLLFKELNDGDKQNVIYDFLKKHPNPTQHPSFNQLSDYNKQNVIYDFLKKHPNPTEHPSFKKLDHYIKQDVIYDFLSKQQEPTKHPLFNQLYDYNKRGVIREFLKNHPNPTEHPSFNQLYGDDKEDVITEFLKKHPNPTEHPLFNQLYDDDDKRNVIKDFLSKQQKPTEHPLFNKLYNDDKQDVIRNFLSKQQKPTEHPLFNKLYNDDKQDVIRNFLSNQSDDPTEHPLFNGLYDDDKQIVIKDFLKNHPNPTEHQSFNQLYDNNDKQDVIRNFLSNQPNDPTSHPLFNQLSDYYKQNVIHNFLTNHRTPESHHLFNRLNDREKGMMLANSLHRDEENRIGRFYRLSPEHLKLLRDVHPELVKRMRSQQYQRNEPLTTPIKSRQRRFNFIESITK